MKRMQKPLPKTATDKYEENVFASLHLISKEETNGSVYNAPLSEEVKGHRTWQVDVYCDGFVYISET